MYWIEVFMVSALVNLVQVQTSCHHNVRWTDLLNSVHKLKCEVSHECIHHYDLERLCNPRTILNKMEHNDILVANILKSAKSLYETYQQSSHVKSLLEDIHSEHNMLATCHPTYELLEPVAKCFSQLEAFLSHKKAHQTCAWEIVNNQIREMLQRLQNRSVRGQRRRR